MPSSCMTDKLFCVCALDSDIRPEEERCIRYTTPGEVLGGIVNDRHPLELQFPPFPPHSREPMCSNIWLV